MNKAIFGILVALTMIVTSGLVSAKGNPNPYCSDYGFENEIKVECSAIPGTSDGITFTGDCKEADWESLSAFDMVIVKASTQSEVQSIATDGMSGTVYCIDDVNPEGKPICHDISHVLFCSDNGGGCTPGTPGCGDNQVPVFPGITVGFAVIGAGLGLALLRKQH